MQALYNLESMHLKAAKPLSIRIASSSSPHDFARRSGIVLLPQSVPTFRRMHLPRTYALLSRAKVGITHTNRFA